MSRSVQWPCVIKFADNDEMQFIGSLQEWLTNPEFCEAGYGADDWLIDSVGVVFSLAGGFSCTHGFGSVVAELTLEQVVQFVRGHASICGQCCVSKMGAPSIEVALRLVGELD